MAIQKKSLISNLESTKKSPAVNKTANSGVSVSSSPVASRVAVSKNAALSKNISLSKQAALSKNISLSKQASLSKNISLSKNMSLSKNISLSKRALSKNIAL